MLTMFQDINAGLNYQDNRFFEHMASTKPYLKFDNKLRLCGSNDLFAKAFKISEEELFNPDIFNSDQNILFLEAVRTAEKDGISSFHGTLYFGTGLPEVHLKAVLFKIRSQIPEESVILCFILESRFLDSDIKPLQGILSSMAALPSYFYASVSVHDAVGNLVYISPLTEVLLGYSQTELMKMDPFFPVHPEDVPIVKEVIEKLNSGGNYLNSRYRVIHKNGAVKNVETISYLMTHASETSNHIVNVTWDLGTQQGIEHALRLSEQKYYRLVMNLPVGVTLINASGTLLEANEAMRKIMRIPAKVSIAELNFLNIEIIKRSGISAQFRRCIETKDVVNGEAQINISRRSPISYLTYSFVPILNFNNDVESVIGYVNDLTKQRKAESDILERADFLNLVINTIKTPFFVKDEKHRWVVLNDAAVQMMGQPRENLIGKSDYDLYPKEQADVFWQYDELVLSSGNSYNEEQITWSDGTLHTIVTYKQLYIEKSTGKKFIVGTIHDITRYKKIEEELRASELKYRELFNNANDFILTADLEGNITNANRTLLKYLRTDLKSLMLHNVFEFIREEDLELATGIKDKMLSGESEFTFELKAYGVDRQHLIYEVKASLINLNGQPVGVQCIFSDITARREASLQLEKLNESLIELNTTKDKFFSIIAHDLRNPYSSMIGFSEMLLEDLDNMSKDEIRDSLKIVHTSAKNSFSLLENLLAWSRLETGHMKFAPVEVNLVNAVEDVVNVLFSLAYRKKIDINNLVEPDVVVMADKNMLNTILNNLLMNAIKFTHPGGEITIFSAPYASGNELIKDYIKISVADTGVGMDAETTEKLFSSNRMVSNPGTDKEQGTGLGLLLTREMVEKHGGKIMVQSSPGEGSVFSFLIPAHQS